MEAYSNFKLNMENPFGMHTKKWIHILITSYLLAYTLGFSILSQTSYFLSFISKGYVRVLHILAIISVVYSMFNRDTFLPFLGESFLPEIFLKSTPRQPERKETDVVITGLEPEATLFYWAADPGKEIAKDWTQGYGRFENSGVLVTDKTGSASIPIQCPARYIVHGYKVLPKHVHYRYYNRSTQMLSKIYTKDLSGQCK